ncbi:helix-turn-helix domain-containing protein [Paenibacillus sp. HJGM_3]
MFLRLFIYSLTVIFFLNLTMGALTYFYFKRTIQQRETKQSQETLNQTKQMVESTIQEIQKVAMAISENISVRKILVMPAGQIGYSDAQAVIGMLNEKISSSNYLHSIYLYNEHLGKIISGEGIISLEQFWDRDVFDRLSHEPPYGRWLEPHPIPFTSGDETMVITYALRIPVGEKADNYVMFNIKMDLFYQTYIRPNPNTSNDVAILNEQGRTMLYNDNSAKFGLTEREFTNPEAVSPQGWLTKTMNGQKMFVSYVKSDFNGWLYIKAAPMSVVFKESDLILKVVLIISLICLAAGTILVLLMSGRYYKPIYSLVQGLSGLNDGVAANAKTQRRTDDLSLLRTTFYHLMKENEHVREEMRRHEAILRDHFLLGLLLGRESDPHEVARSVNYYDLALPDTGYVVLLLHLYSVRGGSDASREQSHILTFRIHQVCVHFLGLAGGGAVISLDHRHIALIMPAVVAQALDADHFAKQNALQLTDRIMKEVGEPVSVGIGAYRAHLYEIEGSFNEAKEALLFENLAGEACMISIWDIRLDYGGTRIWMDFTRKIENLKVEIKLGNLSKSLEGLTEILDEIGDREEVNYREKQLLLSQLVYAVITAMMELNPSLKGIYDGDPYLEYNRLSTMEQIKDWLRGTTVRAVKYVRDKRDNKNADLIQQICRYIESSYREELTLQEIAEKVLMNPQYFSKIFKEVTGKNYLEYLTEVRLAAAARLLESGESKIYEVAEKTGFGNKTNLIRAFKKHYSMTPTDYRNRQIQVGK